MTWADGDLLTPVNLNTKSNSEFINIRDSAFGARGDGVTDDTEAIIDAYTNAESTGRRVIWPAGTYLTSDEIDIDFARSNTLGAGVNQTFLLFMPTVDDKAAFNYGGEHPQFQCSLKGLSVYSNNTSLRKVAIRLTDTSDFLLHEFTVGGGVDWTGGSGGSIGIETNGRDQLSIKNFNVEADRPMVLKPNATLEIDADHIRISEGAFISTGNTYPCVKFEDEVYISNFDMSDVSLNLGLHGVEVGTTAPTASQVFSMNRVRWEQGTGGANSYIVKIDTTGMQNVRLQQVSGGSGTNHSGYYLRGIDRCTLDHCDYNGTGKALDVTGSVQSLTLLNTFFQDSSTVSLGTLVEAFAVVDGSETALAPARRTAFYTDSSVANVHTEHFGVWRKSLRGTLADAASVNIPIGPDGVAAATITVSAAGATDHEAGVWTHSALGTKIVSGTANTDDADTAGNLCVLDAGSLPALKNNLGELITYVIDVNWAPS